MAMSVHTNEDLYNFEPSNRITAPTFLLKLEDDLLTQLADYKK